MYDSCNEILDSILNKSLIFPSHSSHYGSQSAVKALIISVFLFTTTKVAHITVMIFFDIKNNYVMIEHLEILSFLSSTGS